VFGNAGGLYMNAMTWWDHETGSIWAQPVGKALAGPLVDTELTLLLLFITTWGNWKDTYPETLVMVNDLDRMGFQRQGFSEDFVIGLLLGNHAKAYPFTAVQMSGLLNDSLGEYPLLIWASDGDYRAYLRQVEEAVLEFVLVDGDVIDLETGSTWDVQIGLAVDGPLKGRSLSPIPSLTSYDWAWKDFYPDTEIYEP
jgi:hypothetical protein